MQHQKGMTLIEVMFALTVLSIGALAMASAFLSSANLHILMEEQSLASKGILRQISAIRAEAKIDSGTYTYLNAALNTYTNSGNTTFTVDGLNPVVGEATVGQIILHLNESRIPTDLGGDEDTAYVEDGVSYGEMEIDNDPDALSDYSDKSLTEDEMNAIQIIPIEVRVRWQSQGGPQTITRYVSIARNDLGEIDD